MTNLRVRAEEEALWRRWRGLAAQDEAAPEAPDPLQLAAYAEGRLDERGGEAIESWLAANPEAVEDIAAARAVAAREAAVVPFRRPAMPVRNWRSAMAWGGIAASLLAVSVLGFQLGSEAYAESGQSTVASADLLDPPAGLFTGFSEDNGT